MDLLEKAHRLLDDRVTVAIVVEDSLGGVSAWSRRLKKLFQDHPKYNLVMIECPVFARDVTGARDLCCPTREDLHDALAALEPALVVPNYAWEGFNLCAGLIREGHVLRTIGFCRTDEELYYGPLAWYEPIIAQFAAVSPECAATLCGRIPHREDDIHIMPTGVWVPEPLERAYETAPIRLVYGGRMSQVQKRVLDFVPLVRHLIALKADFVLDLVGDGSQTEKLKAAMDRLNHGGRVRFQDTQAPEMMPEIWRAHDVFLQTSEYEGTSNSMLESMAQGVVPVVTDASSGIRSVLTEGKNGFIVPVGDMAAMARCIAELAEAPERIREAGAAAYEKAKEYSMERYRDRFVTMLDRALEEPVRTWPHNEELSPEISKLIKKLKRRPGGPDSPTPRAGKQEPPPARSEPIVLVAAADDKFAMPLAVMVRSVLDNLGAERRLQLYVLDGGITQANKERLRRSWDDPRLHLEWCTPDLAPLRHLKLSGHINAVAYCRLLTPSLLPERHDKAIYLDCDLVLEHDLGAMWDLDIRPHHLLAVQDMTLPYVDSRIALRNYDQCAPFLTSARPITRPEKRGIPATNKYLNSGVLMLNLKRWREDGTATRILEYLEKCKGDVIWHDQDGLNVILHDKWADMDERWNQIPHIYRYPSVCESPFPEAIFERILCDPWIIHFSTRSKPWHFDGLHPAQDRFFHYLDHTDWAGWRPPKPVNLARNGDFSAWAEQRPAHWEAPQGGLFRETETADGEKAVEMRVQESGRNVQLTQRIRPEGDVARQRLVVTLKAMCEEEHALGLNAYVHVDGRQRSYSRNHPGDGRWRTLRHEIDLPIGADGTRMHVLVVLRGHATKPAQVAGAFAAVVPRLNNGKPFEHTPFTRLLAMLPNRVRRLLRMIEGRLRR